MAVVKPFRGWHFNPEKISRLGDVVAPPYDVISPEALKAMRAKSPYHFTKIILPEGENPHARAAETFKAWQAEKILIQDQSPGFYFYKQKFSLTPGERFCQDVSGELIRTSIFCRVKVEDYYSKIILPHEKTFSGPKADRYKLMEQTQGQMEPVFLGYNKPCLAGEDFETWVAGLKPMASYADEFGVGHELWFVGGEAATKKVEELLYEEKFYILDGHHRYETALKYYHDHTEGPDSLQYVLAAVCAFRQKGTVILPTHRALKGANVDEGFANLTSQGWALSQAASIAEIEKRMRGHKNPCFGVRAKGHWYILEMTKPALKLDLEVLHDVVLPNFSQKPELDYLKDMDELSQKVDAGVFKMGFLVRPSTANEVMDVAGMGSTMPHKSTFFYPKIPSGLIINTF